MHRAGVIGQEQTAGAQFFDELLNRGLTNPIHAIIAKCAGNDRTNRCVFARAKEDPVDLFLRGNCLSNFGEPFRQPAFGRPVFSARGKGRSLRR